MKLVERIWKPKTVVEQEVSPTGYTGITGLIHTEFLTASDKLLAEAKATLAKVSTINKEKADRLKKLGFKQVPEVEERNKEELTLLEAKINARTIEDYALRYPMNKFVYEHQVKAICEKYGLVLGEVSDFIGFVPEKNLKEAEQFKLQDQDVTYWTASIYSRRGKKTISTKHEYDEHKKKYSGSMSQYDAVAWTIGTPLEICAPVKDFNMNGKEVSDHKIVNKKVEDPIILQRVERGYLIITAWGPEASDPIVQNPKHN